MKKNLLVTLLLIFSLGPVFSLRADEGMWLPQLLQAMNESEMKELGMKISAEDIYNINKSSLKDAIVSFGGYCTGEIISGEGLLLTNHHCGYSSIQSHSSVENDLLTEGFWAMSKEEEIPNSGLFVTFIVRIEDVTDQILEGIPYDAEEEKRQQLVRSRIEQIETNAVVGTHYEAKVKPFFYGNEYYMFVTETYKDVRLVGAPPSSIGKFGGDTDNWMFPRHAGDFSMFRVYSGPDGKPAEYSKDNIPLKPKYFLPISLKGIQPGDFTMVFGFPGRTEEYLTSFAVETLQNETNPNRIKIRDKKLSVLSEDMARDDEVRIKYSAKYASTANAWKKWIGQNKGLERLETIDQKRLLEKQFTDWANADPIREQRYADILPSFQEVYKERAKINLPNVYYREAFYGIEMMRLAARLNALTKIGLGTKEEKKALEKTKSYSEKYFKNYDFSTDKKLFVALMQMYLDNVDPSFYPDALKEGLSHHYNDLNKLADYIYQYSILSSEKKMDRFLDRFSEKKIKKLEEDEAFKIYRSFTEAYSRQIYPTLVDSQDEIGKLNREWLAGLREMMPEKRFYPDANSTLRLAYGQVKSYSPTDGVQYDYFTTLKGVMEKEDPSVDEFIVSQKLKDLYKAKDFGIYANEQGDLPVCFTATNHTTGGNSGSPILNAEGELIGLNFDRNWEGTMSDIQFDPVMCRNISVDIRYVLFVVDKFAGAGYLVDEMVLVKEKAGIVEN
ncbi:S46 family peptidase [Xanthovirga aplysinae]|uniref:S46 family peptidase n=1 Tax=Xanthovirga aplysinae TaxID=2529853 RepID=UPI0012BD6DD3|nr:S46 family peptidase [Xanthovirga aplysinae]MTI32196.1 S46 family peptidase [Xanthovirga aplysinae]